MKRNRTPLAVALCCMALASGSALAAGDPATGSSASSMDRGTSSASSMDRSRMGTASTHMDSQTVRQVQQALRDKGHNPGPIDGIMGPRTQSALQAFQRSENLSGASGLDQRTLDGLGVQAGSGMGGMGSSPSARGAGDSGSSAGGTTGPTGGAGGTTSGSDTGTMGGRTTDPATTPGGAGDRSGTGSPPGSGTR